MRKNAIHIFLLWQENTRRRCDILNAENETERAQIFDWKLFCKPSYKLVQIRMSVSYKKQIIDIDKQIH